MNLGGRLTFDAIQCVRMALRDQEDEIRQLKRAQNEQQSLTSDLRDQLVRADDIRKTAQKEASDLQKQVETLYFYFYFFAFFLRFALVQCFL